MMIDGRVERSCMRGPAAAAGTPVNDRAHQSGHKHSNAEKHTSRANRHIVSHATILRGLGTLTSETTSCSPAPAMTGATLPPPQILLWPANRVVDMDGKCQSEMGIVVRVAPIWFAKITGTSRSRATSAGIEVAMGPTWPNRQCLRPLSTAREFGPRRRDHRYVDFAAVVVPDPAVHHVGTHSQADAAPRCDDDEWFPTRAKAERLPEDQMPLAVNMDRPGGQADRQCIVEVPAVALDKPGGNSHSPLAAAH